MIHSQSFFNSAVRSLLLFINQVFVYFFQYVKFIQRRYAFLYLSTFCFILVFSSCRSTEDTFKYATIYRGHSIEGLHGRALTFVNEEAIVIAGPKGVFCGKYLGGDLVEQPPLDGAGDIRDIYFFSDGTMSLMSSGDTAKIYFVGFNGEQETVFDSSGVFLDGLDFWDDQNGIVYGDPVNGKFFLAKTINGGKNWTAFTPDFIPGILQNEAGFAASGTGIQCIDDSVVYFATGMADTARLFCSYDRGKNWIVKNTPLKSGDSYGIYSMYFWSENEGMIIGGSWEETEYHKKICYYTSDGGNTWINRSKGLGGYSSCIQGNETATCIFSTGDHGTYFTLDKGITWNLLFERNYYSISVFKDFVAFVGRDGVVEILRFKF